MQSPTFGARRKEQPRLAIVPEAYPRAIPQRAPGALISISNLLATHFRVIQDPPNTLNKRTPRLLAATSSAMQPLPPWFPSHCSRDIVTPFTIRGGDTIATNTFEDPCI